MKNFTTYIKILVLSMMVTVVSCNDVDYNYKNQLEEEILYTTKPDSLDIFVGNGRIQVVPHVSSAFSVSEFIVYYNNREDNQVFPFVKSGELVDSPELIVTGLEEKSYSFEIYSRDQAGNMSVRQNFFTTSYGELYRSTLATRVVKSFVFDGANGYITWLPSASLERGSEVKYTDSSGAEVIIDVPVVDDVTILPNLSISEALSYRSFYVPTPYNVEKGYETSIDEFDSDWGLITIQPELQSILNSIVLTPTFGGVQINWENATNIDINIVVSYTVNGEVRENSIESAISDGELIVAGLDNGAQDIIITVFNATGNGLGDTFNVTPKELVYVSGITNILLPTDESGIHFGGDVKALFDGSLASDSFYHSYGTSAATFGHHFTLDLGLSKNLKKVSLFPRTIKPERNVKVFQLWGINDLTGANTTLNSYDYGWPFESVEKGWTLIGEFKTDSSFNGETVLPAEISIPDTAPNNFRYIRYRAITNWTGHKRTGLAEMEFYAE